MNLTESFFGSLLLIGLGNGLLASLTPLYYRQRGVGRLSGDELRIKQGTAGFDHRLRVFARVCCLSLLSLRVYGLAIVATGCVHVVQPLLALIDN